MSRAGRGHAAYEEIFAELEAPFAFVDLDAMRANAETMLRQASGKPVRVASKSVRCRELLARIRRLEPPETAATGGFQGLLTFTLEETLLLAEQGWENLLLAYPTVNRAALARLGRAEGFDPERGPALMVDSVAHLDLIESALGPGAPPVRVCIDLDAGLRMLGGRVKIGVKRSPVHTPAQAAALAREIERRPRLRLVGMMAYEAQVAGVGDRPPGRPLRGRAIRWMQRRSIEEIAARRAAAVAAVSEITPLEFVNGGGTGSLGLTAREEAVTEVAAGSGFYAPVQFDYYGRISLLPAAGFALPVTRKPAPGVATALGGGYLASGPGDRGRLPVPWLPAGLRLDREEGAGEVQTPLLGSAAAALRPGDRVYFRHVKAGELCERFNTLHLVEGGKVVDQVPTYRGEGHAFL